MRRQRRQWIALDIALFQHHVGGLDRLFCVCRAPKARAGRRMQHARACFLIGGWRVVHRNCAKAITLAEVKRTKFGLADAGGICQNGLENGVKVARK